MLSNGASITPRFLSPLPAFAALSAAPQQRRHDHRCAQQQVKKIIRSQSRSRIALLPHGYAYFNIIAPPANGAPPSHALNERITRAVLRDTRNVLTVSTLLEREYGLTDVCLSVPCIVSAQGIQQGIQQVIVSKLPPDEHQALYHSADVLRDAIALIMS